MPTETEPNCEIEVIEGEIQPETVPDKCKTCRWYEPPIGCKKPSTNPIT